MLVLSRKVGEKILIGDQISVTVVRLGQGAVRIGIEAPTDMVIVREEIKQPASVEAGKVEAGKVEAGKVESADSNAAASS